MKCDDIKVKLKKNDKVFILQVYLKSGSR